MPYVLLVAAAAVWGGSFAVGKVLVGEVDPFVVAWVRFLVASAAFAVGETVLGLRARQAAGRRATAAEPAAAVPSGRAPTWRDWALLGLTGVFGYNAFFFYGLTLTTATESSLICAFAPVVTALIGLAFLGEKPSPRKTAGIALSVLGVALVILGAAAPAPVAAAGGLSPWGRLVGDLLMLASVLCWAIYSLVGKRVLEGTSAFTATARATYWGAAFFTVSVVLRLGRAWPAPALSLLQPGRLPGLLYLALVCTVFGFVAWYRGLEATEVSTAAVFLNLIPVSTLIIAALTLGERLTGTQLGGGALVVAGVTLVSVVPVRESGERPGKDSGRRGEDSKSG